MFIRVTGPGPFAGLLTMSLCSIGMVSKMFIESIEDLDKRILESLDAAGCTTFQKIRYGILPQLTADFTADLRHELLPLERGRRDFAGSDRAGTHHRVDLCKDPRQAGSGVRLCRNEN